VLVEGGRAVGVQVDFAGRREVFRASRGGAVAAVR
jgi:hypothetical protein